MHVHAIIYLSVLFVPVNQSIKQSIKKSLIGKDTKKCALFEVCAVGNGK